MNPNGTKKRNGLTIHVDIVTDNPDAPGMTLHFDSRTQITHIAGQAYPADVAMIAGLLAVVKDTHRYTAEAANEKA